MERCMGRVALITGGAGFIGSHLADKLLERGWQVIVFDNLSTGRIPNVAHLWKNSRFSLIIDDITDGDALTRVVKEFAVEVIYHVAAMRHNPYCTTHPYEAIRINVLGTQAVVEAAITGGVKQIIFTSSADVYAVKDEAYVEDDATDPFMIYGTLKLTAERLLALASTLHTGLSVIVARLFNVYGPRDTNPHALQKLPAQLHHGNCSRVRLGNLWPKQDFIYVADVVEALYRLAWVDVPFDVFNVGSGHGISMQDVVELVQTLLQRPI